MTSGYEYTRAEPHVSNGNEATFEGVGQDRSRATVTHTIIYSPSGLPFEAEEFEGGGIMGIPVIRSSYVPKGSIYLIERPAILDIGPPKIELPYVEDDGDLFRMSWTMGVEGQKLAEWWWSSLALDELPLPFPWAQYLLLFLALVVLVLWGSTF